MSPRLISNSVEAMIKNIVTVVFRIHFYYVNDYDLEQDLKQEGYLKAYELLADGNYDPTRNLRTFIYTGVRNAMTNYMYHNKKEAHDTLENITSPTWQRYEQITMDGYWNGKIFYTDEDNIQNYDLDPAAVYEVCSKYTMFGDYIGVALRELKKLGVYQGAIPPIIKNEVPFIRDAIIGEVLWNIFKK